MFTLLITILFLNVILKALNKKPRILNPTLTFHFLLVLEITILKIINLFIFHCLKLKQLNCCNVTSKLLVCYRDKNSVLALSFCSKGRHELCWALISVCDSKLTSNTCHTRLAYLRKWIFEFMRTQRKCERDLFSKVGFSIDIFFCIQDFM